MTERILQTLQPFSFDPDFSGQRAARRDEPDDEPDTVRLSPRDLAALGASLRAEGMAAAQARIDGAIVERLETAGRRLERASKRLGDVAAALADGSAWHERPGDLATLAAQAAQEIADGQGDLFAASQALAADGAPTPETEV